MNHADFSEAGRVQITYFTDPLCCWSWALEPQWRKLQMHYAHAINWRYVMGGLLPDWQHFHDTDQSVSKPIQMGPVWMQATALSGMPTSPRLWFDNPPKSSYPACIGFVCAAKQSSLAGEIYLRLLREGLMIHGENIAEKEVLLKLASDLPAYLPSFDVKQFAADIVNETGLELFKTHLAEARAHNIERYPTLVFRYAGQAYILTGHRPYFQLEDLLKKLLPGVTALPTSEHQTPNWLTPTPRERQEMEMAEQGTGITI